jgi:UDP-3-O-[3-hydroxymyristoyl] glucosamine N-acyltransferase LpxD
MDINKDVLKELSGLETDIEFCCNALGLSNTMQKNSLSFLDDIKYKEDINNNNHITAVLVKKDLSEVITSKQIILCDDPRYYFYTLMSEIGKRNYVKSETKVHLTARISESAFISSYNVSIGENTIVGPNVSILPDVCIGDNCIIQAGAIIGSEGFEYKRTSKGILSVFHDGQVIIGNNVEIGANTCIDKGFSYRNTIIDDDVKIDNLVYIAHGVQIGKGSFIIACSAIAGSVTIQENVWVGPNVSIAPGRTIHNAGFITLGSVVTKDVEPDQWVTGNFAIPHTQFLKILKKNISDSNESY